MEKEEIRKGKYGIQSRIGNKFHSEIEEIKDKRLINGKSKNRVSTINITNSIIRHKNWEEVKKHIIELDEEEFKNLTK